MKTEERYIPCRRRRLRLSAMGERKAPGRFGGRKMAGLPVWFRHPDGMGECGGNGFGSAAFASCVVAVSRSWLWAIARRGISAHYGRACSGQLRHVGRPSGREPSWRQAACLSAIRSRGSFRCDGHCFLPEDASPSTAGSNRSAYWPQDMADAFKKPNQ
jgi:hypothetical protein